MNQCMGCQAGWPRWYVVVDTMNAKRRPIPSYYFHEVVGGYPHERVACTADRYETK